MRKLILAILTIFYCLNLNAQSTFIDSLYQAYLTEPVDTKFKSLYRYCFYLNQYDMDKAMSLIKKGDRELIDSGLSESDIAYYMGLFCEVKAMNADNRENMATSLGYYQQCYEFSKKVDGKKKFLLRGMANYGMGAYYYKQGIREKSNQQFLKAKEAYLASDQIGNAADCLAMIAQNYHEESKFDSTLLYVNQAISMIDRSIDITNFYGYLFQKVNAFNALPLPDSTIASVTSAVLDKSKSISPVLYAHLSFGLADAYSAKNMVPQAKKRIELAKKVMESTEEAQLYYNYLDSNYRYLLAAKDYKGAHAALVKFEAQKDTLEKQLHDSKFLELQSKYNTQNVEFENATLKNKNRYQNNLLKLGLITFAIILGGIFFWVRLREEKIKAIQSKNNQQVKVAIKYNDPEPDIEDEFLKNITGFIATNLSRADLTVEDLVKHCDMNRNEMNKKIKSLTNKTAVGLIRDMRLEKGYALLLDNDKNVSQVAFEVGFKDPNYFSSCFREKFQISPSEILKN